MKVRFVNCALSFLAVWGLLWSLSLRAEDWTVTSTGFQLIGSDSTIAELCGLVNGPEGKLFGRKVRVEVDPESTNPRVYMATSDSGGKFCLLVKTTTGEARILLPSAQFSSYGAAGGEVPGANTRFHEVTLSSDDEGGTDL